MRDKKTKRRMKKFFHSTEKQPAGPESGPDFCRKNSRMGQTWVKSDFGTVCGQKEIPKNGGVKPFLGICLVAGEGLEPTTSGL